MRVTVRNVSVRNGRDFESFLAVPRRIYDGQSPWVAPLNREIRRKLDPGQNSFFQYGKVNLLVAHYSDATPCGRVAAIFNPRHEEIHGEKMGFFGLFECVNAPEPARALMTAVLGLIDKDGCKSILGPVNLTTNDESGFLVEGYEHPPTFMCNYCPPYYHDLMAACGFSKAVDTFSYMARLNHRFPDKYYRLVRKAEADPRITLRQFSKTTAGDDILTIADIYNESFRETWGFVPMSEGEARELGRGLIPIADFDLVWIAYYDGEPVGAILGFPDINEILIKLNGRLLPFGFLRFIFGLTKIRSMRVAALGVRPQFRKLGIETLLIHKVHQRVLTRPYQRSEFSVVMENNFRMRNLLERFGFEQRQRFRLYSRTLPG
ncbi:MAG: GNAT family N-acetyltransferase [candidate division Zixibacteria bacterium]|nr:GNAT family N-acetyltransferase [candidate division Zixibacteria bacterium]